MMMIMRADRQGFDDVTGHMYLKFIFIGQTFCKQKTSQNKFLSAPQTANIMQHQDQDYIKDKD